MLTTLIPTLQHRARQGTLLAATTILLLVADSASAYVAIDTGHTPEHAGAKSASGKTEHSFNARFVERLKENLAARGRDVKLVPAKLGLSARADWAANAELLVSIHHDSVQPQFRDEANRFAGYSLFVSRQQPSHPMALACARHIAVTLQRAGRHHTTHHAEPIPGENRPWAVKRLGIHYFDDLILLKRAKPPALLLEVGVIANPDEERLASSPAWIEKQAKAAAKGIDLCLRHRQ